MKHSDMQTKYRIKRLPSEYRWVILLLLFVTIMIAFMGRLSTSVALGAIGDELVWSQADTGFLGGILMGIFLVSYGFSNIVLSPNIDRHGSKVVLFCSMVGCSLAVFLGGYYGHIYSLFLASRLLLGLTQGILFPLSAKVIAGWYGVRDRGRANAIFMLGAPIGIALAPILMGPIIHAYSWQFSFYVLALIGFLLAVPILFFVEDAPYDKNTLTITRNRDIDIKKAFKKLLADPEFRLIVVGFTTVNTMYWGTTLWLPTYLEETTGISLGDQPYMAAIPYIGCIAGLLVGAWISNVTGKPSRVIVFSFLTTSMMVAIMAFSPLSGVWMAVLMLTLVFFFAQLTPTLFFTKLQNSIDTRELGSATGLMNGIANTVGVMGPVSVGVVVALSGSYRIGILCISAIALIGLVGYKRMLRICNQACES